MQIKFLWIFLFLLNSCTFNNNKISHGETITLDIKAELMEVESIERYWIKKEYFDCLKEKLPCQCIGGVPHLLKFNKSTLTIVEFNGNEENYDLSEIDSNNFTISTDYREEKGLIRKNHIRILNDSNLTIDFGSEKSHYISIMSSDDYRFDFIINFELFIKNWFDEKLDSLCEIDIGKYKFFSCLSCNEKENVLSGNKSCKNDLIIENRNDSLYFYRFNNSCVFRRETIDKILVFKMKR